jgi:hypothetical protein
MGLNKLIEVLFKATPNRAETASRCDVFWQPRVQRAQPGRARIRTICDASGGGPPALQSE